MRAGILASEDAKVGANLHAAATTLTDMIPARWAASGGQLNKHKSAPDALGKRHRPEDIRAFSNDDDYLPPADEVANWYADWEDIQRELAAHNAQVAAHLRAKPPKAPGNHAAVAAWNARGAQLQAKANRIYDKQLQLSLEAAGLGIPKPTITPPKTYDDPAQVPQGTTVPSSLISMKPTTGKAMPI